MKKIGIILAMQKELDLYIKNIEKYDVVTFHNRRFYTCKYNGMDLIIAVSGIGKVSASLTATSLINNFSPDLIINIGVSGGLDKRLNIGDWVLGLDLHYHDFWCGDDVDYENDPNVPHTYHSDTEIAERQQNCFKGLLCSGDQFITDIDKLAYIKSQYPDALAVDMESTAIAQTCDDYGVRFLCMRQISDVPGVENHGELYFSFWKNAPENSYKMFKNILDSL